jgi:hypothetical protein
VWRGKRGFRTVGTHTRQRADTFLNARAGKRINPPPEIRAIKLINPAFLQNGFGLIANLVTDLPKRHPGYHGCYIHFSWSLRRHAAFLTSCVE